MGSRPQSHHPTAHCVCLTPPARFWRELSATASRPSWRAQVASRTSFRRGRSTVDAIQTVVSTARKALEGNRWLDGTIEYCAVVTLDVKNAFNSVQWNNILNALSRIHTPEYLMRIINSYFQARVLNYSTDDGPESCSVAAGVPQGSVLGPTLWNVMYDAILQLEFQSGVQIIGFADDIALVGVAKYL
uniref:Reverse transcriptase domain-containing protein n=1 Tax=Trichogramma kaykai TaxID=54128 RepID=A0ABD2W5G2_9HYME